MSRARHPKPYKTGRTQITIPWKRRVLAALDANKDEGITPSNIEQLRVHVGAKKGGLNKTFDLKKDPPQLTSSYADEISEALRISPPLIEQDEDDEDFICDVQFLRTLSAEVRRDLIALARKMTKKS